MGNAFRQHPGPAIYAPKQTPVTDDLLEVGLLVAFGMIGFSFLIIIPGIRGWEVIGRASEGSDIRVDHERGENEVESERKGGGGGGN